MGFKLSGGDNDLLGFGELTFNVVCYRWDEFQGCVERNEQQHIHHCFVSVETKASILQIRCYRHPMMKKIG